MKFLGRIFPCLRIGFLVLATSGSGWAQTKPVEGAKIWLEIDRFAGKGDETGDSGKLELFVDRPHLLGGLSFVLMAPEHPYVDDLTAPALREEMQAYAEGAKAKTLADRVAAGREVSGIFAGSYVVNPLTGWLVPVWVSDAVAGEYPAQVLPGIPAHDPLLFEFARSQGIEVVPVIRLSRENGEPDGAALQRAYTGKGTLVESGDLTGTEVTEARGRKNPAFAAAMKWLEEKKAGEAAEGWDYGAWVRAQSSPVRKGAALAAGKDEPTVKGASRKGEGSTANSGAASSGRREKGAGERLQGEAKKGDVVRQGGGVRPGMCMMVDRSWLFSKPRMGAQGVRVSEGGERKKGKAARVRRLCEGNRARKSVDGSFTD